MHRSTRIKLFALGLAVALAALLVGSASASRPPTGKARGAAAPKVATVARALSTPKALAFLSQDKVFSDCTSGAHSLSKFGDRLYPEMGNGGYTSQHTDLYLNYDAIANTFLPGTHADLQVSSTQCLSDLSFDFEQTNGHTADGSGPNMTVNSVEVNGQPASFTFKQPTYPGDPNGQDDPDPAAHAVSNANPVSATNPNPPACSPQVNNATQNGTQCGANKLVVTPSTPIPAGTTVTVTIDYTGRPGVHTDGDGSTEGWFRIATAGSEGSFVTTEPVGNDSWMPMNNFPTAKPTYDIYDTTNIGKTAVGPGELVGYTAPVGTSYVDVPPPASNPPDANFPNGSVTWHWHSPERIANYLVENSIGAYNLSARTSPTSGVQYWEAQASTITAAKQATNKTAMDNQEDIVNFQTNFNGPWPATTDGIVVGTPSASFEEEMQGKITFAGGSIGPSLGTFNHENMHQWFGDNVSEGAFNLTFWKEGFATLGEYLTTARGTPPGVTGGPAFEASLVSRFNGTGNYNTTSGTFWNTAPSNPTVGSLFTTSNTYTRPGTAYVALWEALTRPGMIAAMQQIQSTYKQGNITEQQEEDIFRQHLPVNSASCNARLTSFFTQWFDTAYPSGAGNRPQITGTGLNGPGFTCAAVSPASPDGQNGWYKSPVTLAWSGFPTVAAPTIATNNGCVNETISTDGTFSRSCGVTVRTTTTLAAPAAATATNVKVTSVTGLFAGETMTIDSTGANPETVTMTSVGAPRTATTLAAASIVGATNIKVASVTNMVAGELISIDTGANQEIRTIQTVGTSGSGGTGVTLTTSLANAHNSGVAAQDLGTGVTFTPALASAHATAATADALVANSGAVSEAFKIDATAPTTTATINPASPDGQNGWYLSPPSVTLSATDGTSGVASTKISLDGGPFTDYAGAISPSSEGGHSLSFFSTDSAGNVEPTQTITWAVDTMAPTTTAVLTPGLHNGYYANPALTFTVADGHGSGDITDPCPPRVICAFTTMVAIDGGAFAPYVNPIHFTSGNHFAQYFTKDAAGRTEATKLIAFKVDAEAPTVNVAAPAEGADYPLGKAVTAKFKCTDRLSGIDTCVGTVANGAALDTRSVGAHTFTVTATDRAGNVTTVTRHYSVRFVWNGFFAPITNTETGKLNLVHAGDPIKLGFGLNGDQGGANNVFAPGYPKIIVIPCPPWPVHMVAAAGSPFTPGLSFGAASGHYSYGWQTSSAFAGTCQRFDVQLNDGSGIDHSADFMFFG